MLRQQIEQRRQVVGRFVERDGDGGFVEEAEVDAGLGGAGDQRRSGFVFRSDADGVEKGGVMDGMAGFFEGFREICGVAVNSRSDRAQALGTVVDGIHRGHDGEQNLGGADVAGGLISADVLLAGLEREA